ncbi:MAG: polyphenol oxidase family protein [Brevinema sp.]
MPFFIWPQFPHICAGTTTRAEGNFSQGVAFDEKERMLVQDRRELLRTTLGFDTMHTFRQTHSTILLPPQGCSQTEADGLIGNIEGELLAINTADCIPLFFYAPDIKTVSIVHCGRIGLKNNIAQKALDKLVERGANPAQIYIHVGPHISATAYEVSREILEEFHIPCNKEKGYLDMQTILIQQLLDNNIDSSKISTSNMCTLTSKDTDGKPLFYSHRGGNKERIFSFIGIRK